MTYDQLAARVFNRCRFNPDMLKPKSDGEYNDTWLIKYQLVFYGFATLKSTSRISGPVVFDGNPANLGIKESK